MITPALFILGSASLVASALLRMSRVVDRARVLSSLVQEGTCEERGVTHAQMRDWLNRHAQRARQAERAIALFYSVIVLFIASCLSIAATQLLGDFYGWIALTLAILGTLLMFWGGAFMVIETRWSGQQIRQEIRNALTNLEQLES